MEIIFLSQICHKLVIKLKYTNYDNIIEYTIKCRLKLSTNVNQYKEFTFFPELLKIPLYY